MNIALIFIALVSAAYVTSVEVADSPADTPSVFGYITKYGIPEAERIRKLEEEYINEYSKIVGGVPASQGQYPYQVGLISSVVGTTGRGVCGGCLVGSNTVLTAAHCWFDGINQAWKYEVVLGSALLFTGGTRVDTSAVVMHPQWRPLLIRNDIAIVYLPLPVSTSTTISPIALPTRAEAERDWVGSRVIVSGYGLTQNNGGISNGQFLSHVSLNVISNSVCSYAFPFIILPSHICTSGIGGSGPCNGDSGGPLVANSNGRNILLGIVSFGSAMGCEANLPAAYTRVSYFLDFLERYL